MQLDKPTASSELLRRELTIAAREASPNTALLLSGRIDSSALAALTQTYLFTQPGSEALQI